MKNLGIRLAKTESVRSPARIESNQRGLDEMRKINRSKFEQISIRSESCPRNVKNKDSRRCYQPKSNLAKLYYY